MQHEFGLTNTMVMCSSFSIQAGNRVAAEMGGVAPKLQKNDLKGAMSDFNQAMLLNPQSGLAYRNRGRAEQKMDDPNAAIADFNRALKLGVTNDF
jgi:tetratricopeptide (TPR) repeat protein